MLRPRSVISWGLLIGVAWSCVACSAEKPPERPGSTNTSTNPGSSTAGSGAASGKSGNGDKPDAGDQTDNPTQPSNGGNGGGGSGGKTGISSLTGGTGGRSNEVQTCASTSVMAQEVPVDMYIMLDRSDSMQDKTGAGPIKWDAVRIALNRFLRDQRSNGLSVGLGFFPQVKPGVPDMCANDMECGVGGPCFNGICKPSQRGSFLLIRCATMNDCPPDAAGCTKEVGQCQRDPSLICFDLGAGGCGFLNACEQVIVPGFCGGADSCEAGDYAKPAVPIAILPGNAMPLIDTLDATKTVGRTPTSAALRGALSHANEHATKNPNHRVIAVLATDGLPTECEPLDSFSISDLSAQALAASPSIPTYVVGVFGPDDVDARSNLNTIASAGGTGTALILDSMQDVAQQFLDALDKIRAGSIACEYQLPPSPASSALDLDRVNVELVEASGTREFRYVGESGRCGATPLGWHYDADPMTGKPTKIVACPKACDALKSTDAGRVEIKLGCQTKGPD